MLAEGKIQREIAEHHGFKDKYVVEKFLARERRQEVRAKVKYHVIHRCRTEYPVAVMCKFFWSIQERLLCLCSSPWQTGHSSCRTHRPETGTQLPYLWIPVAVAEKQKIFCNPKTVLRIMKKYDLLSEVHRPKRWKQVGQQVHKYKNLLNREFRADQPNRKWVTDISYIHTN